MDEPRTHEFDDLLGLTPAPLAQPVPHTALRRAPVTIDHESQTPVVREPTPVVRKASAARIRQMASDIVESKREALMGWIDKVAEVSPKAAADLVLQLMEFSTPRLKAQAIAVQDSNPAGSKNPRQLSTSDLVAMLTNDGDDD